MSLRQSLHRLMALARTRRLDRDLDDEVAAHLEMAEDELRAQGLSADAARLEARRRFGGVPAMREAHRDDRSARWIEHLLHDARHGLAALWREPLFTAIAVGVLALGIGANTAMFSLIDGVLFKPLPFPNPERIVRVWETPTATASNSTTTATFQALKQQNRTFESLSAESLSTATVDVQGEPIRLAGRYVSFDHFDVFGVRPSVGRTFRPEEDVDGAEPVVILSHAAWVTHFGGDRGLIGQAVRLDGVPHRVIGVLPAGTFDKDRARPLDEPAAFWRLNAFTEAETRQSAHWLNPVGRLKPGVTVAQAKADVAAIRERLAPEIPIWKQHWGMTVEPFGQILVGERLRQALYVAFGAVVLVLLIAAANITNLLLTRASARRKEIAVRAALGASRGRIAAQLLTESLLLGLFGGAAGVALAAVLVRAAVPFLPAPFTADIALDARVLTFAVLVTVTVSALVGTLPAWRLTHGPATAALQAASRGSTGAHDRTRRSIVVAEVALSVVLLAGGFLLFTSLARLQHVDVGARLDDVVTMSVDVPRYRYPDGAAIAAFYPTLVARVQAVPGVAAASMSGDVPLEGTGGENLRLPGRDDRLLVRFKRIDAHYLDALGIRLAAGRGFAATDRVGAPHVAVVNEALAARLRQHFGLSDVVGQAVDLPWLGFGPDRRVVMTVVGVVANERVRSDLRAPVEEVAYVPIEQHPRLQVKLSVWAPGRAVAIMPAVREAVRQVEPAIALADVRTVRQIWSSSLSGLREPVWLVGAFATVSALLAALGLYGVVSHAVAQRRREIGIRMAMGATSQSVVSDVVRGTAAVVGLGVAVGVAGAAALSRIMTSLLFDVSALDPRAYVFAGLVMALLALAAAVGPARRAARVDPVTALRAEG